MQEGRGKLESLVREKGKLAFLSAPGGRGVMLLLKFFFKAILPPLQPKQNIGENLFNNLLCLTNNHSYQPVVSAWCWRILPRSRLLAKGSDKCAQKVGEDRVR